MPSRQEICDYVAELFSGCRFQDHSNNGLQVEGKDEVNRIAFAVDACQRVFTQAAAGKFDLLVVHHGMSWGGGIKMVSSYHAERLKTLLCHGISLLAYHLPLDAHPEFGNNAVLADLLGLEQREPFFPYDGDTIGFCGQLPAAQAPAELCARLEKELGGRCLTLPASGNPPIRRLGIVSGGGGSAIEYCQQQHLDCLLTGEIGHQHVHYAWELGITVIAAGHYATETTGIKALQKKIAAAFPVECEFLDCPTGL